MRHPAFTLYDQVAYRTLPMPQTHPDRLATIALLFGMNPRGIDDCRVLELGCGDGTNLIAMAYGLPASEFIGIDLAPTAVAAGTALISALGLSNVVLHHRDLMDATEALGTFDYIVAHGLYSWIPTEARDRLLAICRAHLAPHGVAYLSYNAYPGGHLRQAIRQIFQFHVAGIEDPRECIAQARALARFMAECPRRTNEEDPSLREEMQATLERSPGVLFHDDLAPVNTPVYFHEFVAHAERHDLQFLAEANFHEMQEHTYPTEIAERIQRLSGGDVLLKEQYLDFLKNRRFRQTLLCRKELTLDRVLRSDIVRRLYLGSPARPVAERPDICSRGVVEEFVGPRGSTMATDFPLAKAAVFHLAQMWPRLVPFADLMREAGGALGDGHGSAAEGEIGTLADILLAAYSSGLVEFATHAPHLVLEPGPRPTASALARLQAARGPFVATLRHTSVYIEDALGRHLLQLMDGTRSREALLREMTAHASSLAARSDDSTLSLEVTAAGLETKIAQVARLALLIA